MSLTLLVSYPGCLVGENGNETIMVCDTSAIKLGGSLGMDNLQLVYCF